MIAKQTYQYDDAQWVLRRWEQAKTLRSAFETEWMRAARYCLPGALGHWQSLGHPSSSMTSGAMPPPTADSTGKLVVPRFVAICHRLATPKSQTWHKLTASNRELMKSRAVQLYFDELNSALWKKRYEPKARFSSAQSETYQGLGVYGNGMKWIASRRKTPLAPKSGLFYRSIPLGDVWVMVDEEGNVDTVFRQVWLTSRQAVQKFGIDGMPEVIRADHALPTSNRTFQFIHCVMPREDWDKERMDAKRFPLASVWVSVEGKQLIEEPGGYHSWPYNLARHFTMHGIYGLGPASLTREALGSANEIKKTLLKQGQKAVDPPLLTHDDGIMNGKVDIRSGAVNPGGVNAQGQPLVHPLAPGNFQWGDNLLEDERQAIKEGWLVDLFQILTESPDMTATEVMDRVSKEAAIAAPMMERLQSEDLGPSIERELDVLNDLDELPEMPPEMIEANGEYEVVYTSPLAKSQNAEQISGFMRIAEMAMQAAQATGDPRPLRRLDFDRAIPEIADILSVPARWLKDDDAVAASEQDAAEGQDIERLSKAAPAIAGMVKAAGTMAQPTKQGK